MLLAEPPPHNHNHNNHHKRGRRKRVTKAVARSAQQLPQPSAATAAGARAAARLVLTLVLLYVLFLCQTERLLTRAEQAGGGEVPLSTAAAPPAHLRRGAASLELEKEMATTAADKFLLFDSVLSGQGTGNIVSGLLAAHLLGREFNRTVCILPTYHAFLSVFDAIGADAVAKCPGVLRDLLQQQQQRPAPATNVPAEHRLSLVNFDAPPDECHLQALLQSDDAPLLYLKGNTYPRWPAVPDNYFFEHYRAKPALLAALPYDQAAPPAVVVHLRAPDGDGTDARAGLDEASLAALERAVPANNPNATTTYLVTNRVAYYERFERCCRWAHPDWRTVVHSANGKQWGSRDTAVDAHQDSVDNQNLQMWADWYTILTATTVYHTHSDFSISAIHWTNKRDSHSIVGSSSPSLLGVPQLETARESWWIDGETAPLSARTRDAAGTARLRLCDDGPALAARPWRLSQPRPPLLPQLQEQQQQRLLRHGDVKRNQPIPNKKPTRRVGARRGQK